MANLPSRHPNLALHLTDRALTPLITSAGSQHQMGLLERLSHAALSAHESALRLGLGAPQRIMVEHGAAGPVLLQTLISPQTAGAGAGAGTTAAAAAAVSTTIPLLSRDDQHGPNGGSASGQHQGAFAHAAETRNPSLAAAAAAAAAVAVATTAPAATASATAYNGRGGTGASPNNAAAAADNDDDDDDDDDDDVDGRRGYHHRRGFSANDADTSSDDGEDGIDDDPNAPAMLIGIVAAQSADDTLEAHRAAARLERVGREVQVHWSDLQELPAPPPPPPTRGRVRIADPRGGTAAD